MTAGRSTAGSGGSRGTHRPAAGQSGSSGLEQQQARFGPVRVAIVYPRQALGFGYAVEPVAEQGAFSGGERRRGPDGFAMVTARRPGDLGAVRRGLA